MTVTTPAAVEDRPLEGLRRRLTGALGLPGDELHTRLATPWNVAVRCSPAAVVEARSAQDVVEAVRFAAAAGLPVGVQCTGHGVADALDGALLVSTGRLDACVVHPDGWARVGAGVRWQAVLDEAAVHGLAPLCGSSPDVGVVGYTTGGGLGPMARTYGWASDRVRAIEVVTGDGVLRRATPDLHADLFWALRGGKGALGIVTAMEFDLVAQPTVLGGALYFDGADAATVLHTWASWCPALPEQATTSVAVLQLPPLPGVPPPLAGRTTVAVRFVWTGDAAEGERLLEPVRSAARPLSTPSACCRTPRSAPSTPTRSTRCPSPRRPTC
jgi:FAD/FMN-containing dehydrogenase